VYLPQTLPPARYLALYSTAGGLYFCFTRSTTASPASLAFQVFPHAFKAGEYVLVLCQFHLYFGLRCFCAAGKNIEYQVAAVYHLYAQLICNIAYLRACKLIVENDQ